MNTREEASLVDLLPHREPFRFVTSVERVVAGERAIASYQVTGHEPFLAGHFPGNPIFPGVLQLEALAQTGALAVLSDDRYAGKLPLFGGVENVRFRRRVVPGDELRMDVMMDKLGSRGGWGTGRASVHGQLTCEARLFFVIG